MAHIAIFLAAGFEEVEALTVCDICRRAGIDTDLVSIEKNVMVESSHKVHVEADMSIDEVEWDGLDMLVLPGGMPGTLNLEACDTLMRHVDDYNRNGRYISAICAAPGIFGRRGILKGRRACIFPGMEAELHEAEVVYDSVAVSDHVMTSRGMGTAIDFGLAIVDRLMGEEAAEGVGRKIVYKKV